MVNPFRDEVRAFFQETGVTPADLMRRAGTQNVALISRILHSGAIPRTKNLIALREAMASYRAEIAARLSKAAQEGRDRVL